MFVCSCSAFCRIVLDFAASLISFLVRTALIVKVRFRLISWVRCWCTGGGLVDWRADA